MQLDMNLPMMMVMSAKNDLARFLYDYNEQLLSELPSILSGTEFKAEQQVEIFRKVEGLLSRKSAQLYPNYERRIAQLEQAVREEAPTTTKKSSSKSSD